jgi:rubrerythrin
MRPELEDIRLLKLAEMYEEAYERFVVELATHFLRDPALRERILQVASPEDQHHERIVAQLDRLNGALAEEDRAGMVRAALLDVRDVERAARDFYLAHVDRVHDPEVARLFRQLAAEEGRHLRIAEETLRIAERAAPRPTPDELRAAAALRMLDADEPGVLREGVSDFGAHHRHAP